MNKRLVFAILVTAQLAVPSWMIASQEHVLRNGDLYKFKTAPVDPYDIFRGRYVALSTGQRSIKLSNNNIKFDRGQEVFVIIKTDSQGFAHVVDAKTQKPKGNNYIKTTVSYQSYGDTVRFNLPLNRYYMNEEKAPQAEQLYRENSRRNKQDAYVLVRVLNGTALIEGLYVNNKPIESYF
ncbi:MAG: GDYXXLXY domain-containing protein [Candidatus Omnitrophica bacterium]|nr:GDYXXLXY domain-containing protein [Candidatus Omnitrophota bacterium]